MNFVSVADHTQPFNLPSAKVVVVETATIGKGLELAHLACRVIVCACPRPFVCDPRSGSHHDDADPLT
jgi:hypothetical protein